MVVETLLNAFVFLLLFDVPVPVPVDAAILLSVRHHNISTTIF